MKTRIRKSIIADRRRSAASAHSVRSAASARSVRSVMPVKSVMAVLAALIVLFILAADMACADEALLSIRRPRRARLSGNDAIIYDAVKSAAEEIAAGERDSSRVVVPIREMLGNKMTYTADDLGVSELVIDDEISQDAVDALNEKFNFDSSKLQQALISDLPYDLYWYDKTNGLNSKTQDTGLTANNDGSGWVMTFDSDNPVWVLDFYVASDYSRSGKSRTTDVDTSKTLMASEVVDTAREIVEENADKSDLEKLKAYKDKICELASYNHDVALNASESGNPWQLIYVFDGDDSTNVVCEGYAKAFQYLCDLTTFRSGRIRSHLVIGEMEGGTGAGPHMWNIVHMNDGRNYMVDVTNCDENTVGAPDLLFLKGYTSGSVKDGYTYDCDGDEISFKYDKEMFETYYEGELTLSDTDYVEVNDPESDDLLTQIAIEMCLLFMDTCNPEALTV